MNTKGLKIQIFEWLALSVILCLILSTPAFSQDNITTEELARNLVQYALIPIQYIITYIAYIMGFFFLGWGMFRLRHAHEGGGFNRQHSGITSVLCFVAAAFLFQYQDTIGLIGRGILGATPDSGGWVWTKDENGNADTLLPLDPENLFGYLNVQSADDTASGGILTGTGDEAWEDALMSFYNLQTLFAVLMIIGFISFLRGTMLIVKMGEGMAGGESNGTKAIIHIIAAALLCNANHFSALISNLSSQITAT